VVSIPRLFIYLFHFRLYSFGVNEISRGAFSSHKNGVKDEAMGSRSTKCVNLSLKENIINFLVVGLIYFRCV
jgi:hypothetical protein